MLNVAETNITVYEKLMKPTRNVRVIIYTEPIMCQPVIDSLSADVAPGLISVCLLLTWTTNILSLSYHALNTLINIFNYFVMKD